MKGTHGIDLPLPLIFSWLLKSLASLHLLFQKIADSNGTTFCWPDAFSCKFLHN